MTPERWTRVKRIFDRLMDEPSAGRQDRLRRECAEDPALEDEVRSLLEASFAAGDFLEGPPAGQMQDALASRAIGGHRSRIGAFEVVRELGQGGMGTVYLAVRDDGQFRQTAALKLVRRGMDTDFILERFRSERQILAALDHPHIARVFDGGSTEDGLPYFVMEYIPGVDLLRDCDARGRTTRERLDLFLRVCEAAAYAHQQLVVHRDIKPGNILVTPDGVPKLLDFGLAKLLAPDLPESAAERTETALRFLTPEYASPEQVRGERISTASDIYSLGVVLYELLTGHRPYRLAGRRPDEIARAVCEEEPERPSTVVGRIESVTGRNGRTEVLTPASIAATRGGEPSRLRRALRGDLDNIILMALRKEPDRRYASVEQLAADICRHLEGRPVKARKDTVAYRTGKFLSRHRAGVAVSAVMAVAILAAASIAVREARVARMQHREAERHFNEVRELTNSFLFEFHDAIQDLPGATPARQLVVRRALDYLEKLSAVKNDDPALRLELAEAYERIARVQGGMFESHLGDTAGARRSILKALAIREDFARAEPKNPVFAAALAEAELQLSEVLLVARERAAAVARARHAVSILEGLGAGSLSDRIAQARLGRARRYLGSALSSGSDRAEGLSALTSAASTFESLCASAPSGPTSGDCHQLAITHQLILHSLGGTRDRAAAFASYRRSVLLLEAIVRARPVSFSLKRELAYCHMDMGSFLEWSEDYAGALTYHGHAVPMLEDLATADSRNADIRLLLAEAYNSFGYASARTGDVPVAFRNLKRSDRLLESVVSEDPANGRARLGLARLSDSYGFAFETDASKTRGEARALSLESALDWYRKSRRSYVALFTERRPGAQEAWELSEVSKKIESVEKRLGRSRERERKADG